MDCIKLFTHTYRTKWRLSSHTSCHDICKFCLHTVGLRVKYRCAQIIVRVCVCVVLGFNIRLQSLTTTQSMVVSRIYRTLQQPLRRRKQIFTHNSTWKNQRNVLHYKNLRNAPRARVFHMIQLMFPGKHYAIFFITKLGAFTLRKCRHNVQFFTTNLSE